MIPASSWMCAAVILMLTSMRSGAQAHDHASRSVPSKTASTPVVTGSARLQNISREPNTVEVSLTAAPVRLSLVPGKMTEVYAYNGRVPGPLLEVREGDRVIVHFKNDLPVATTVHWHGFHIPANQDGSPFYMVGAGEEYTYEFTMPPGSAGTYWYHPHPHHYTAHQVGMGLYAPIIVRAPDDPLAGIPEKVFILSDNRFRADGSLDFPDPQSIEGRFDVENGREGDVLFVNDQIVPTITIRSGEVQRWRVINASSARIYRLALQGHTFLHVGTDGGLFEHPIEVSEITLANSERVELLVRGTAAPGTRAVLQTLPYDRYIPQTRPNDGPLDWKKTRDLLTLQYTPERAVREAQLPASLRRVPSIDTSEVTVRRVLAMSQHMINGRQMDMARVDQIARLGATEIWEIENLVGMDHPFHLHGFQFQVLDRNGVPEKQRQWKDTVNVPKHQTARFVVRLANHPGKWMFHCHILDHEDAGMMGVLEVQ